jgi:hypothetical protein
MEIDRAQLDVRVRLINFHLTNKDSRA